MRLADLPGWVPLGIAAALVVVGYLVAGVTGLVVGAVAGFVVVFAMVRPPRRPLR